METGHTFSQVLQIAPDTVRNRERGLYTTVTHDKRRSRRGKSGTRFVQKSDDILANVMTGEDKLPSHGRPLRERYDM